MNEQLDKIRHSTSHILAYAVRELFGDVKFAIGPTIDEGFYYDFDLGEKTFSPEDLKAIDKKMDRYIVTRRGKPAAVIMGLDDYEGLMETLAILSDKPALKRLKQAEADLQAGRTRSLDDVRRELDAL